MPPRRKPVKPQAEQQLSLIRADRPEQPPAWTVSEVWSLMIHAMDDHPVLGRSLTIRAALSNVRPASSGHLYFTLNDDHETGGASLNAVMWRTTVAGCPFRLQDGMTVFVTGTLNVYTPGGSVSLVVRSVLPDGMGALQLAMEQLKVQLSAEGLFDVERKRALPMFAQRIGIVTSPTGAVIHDMLRVLRRKHPSLFVLLAPVAVQGEAAPAQIVEAINRLNDPAWALDVLILARGGGSLEDLFCFYSAEVVRAVAASRLPMVTGIGHQPDFTLADAAADMSAATPTAAAEAVAPDRQAWAEWLSDAATSLDREITRLLATAEQTLDAQAGQLADLQQQRLLVWNTQLSHWRQQLADGLSLLTQQAETQLAQLADSLHQLSPLAVLGRGYAMVSDAQGRVVTQAAQTHPGQHLQLRWSDGQVGVTIGPEETVVK